MSSRSTNDQKNHSLSWTASLGACLALGFGASAALGSDVLAGQASSDLHAVAGEQAVQRDTIRLLIGFDHPPTDADVAMVEAAGGEIRWVYRIIDAVAASVPTDAVDAIANLPSVTIVEEALPVQAFDAELDNTWGVKRIGGGFAHDQGQFGTGVKVAVLDTGIDYTHPELSGIYMGGYDFVNNDPDPMDDHFHGTHVAGTISAAKDGVGVVGVAPQIELYALKVLNAQGSGNFDDIIAALDWAVDNDIEVTNQSLGSPFSPGQLTQAAYNAAWEEGIIHIASAGNFFGIFGVSYPARFDSLVAVAATTQSNTKANFSDTGPQVEMAAPGVGIPSSVPGGGYRLLDGTSMASPHVAGVAALAIASGTVQDLNQNGRINDEVRLRLQETAIDLEDFGRDNRTGFGLTNASTAIRESMSLEIDPLIRGQRADLTVSGAAPGGTVVFAYSASGTGPTPVKSLSVVLSLKRPVQIGSAQVNSAGVATLGVNVPSGAPLIRIQFQAAETGHVSAVVMGQIQ